MTDTLWGDRRPGSDIAVGQDEHGGYAMLGDPDWVRTPPELGSLKLRVARIYDHVCPCRSGHSVKTFAFEGSDLNVSECPTAGFLWWKVRAAER